MLCSCKRHYDIVLDKRKPVYKGFGNNKGADQPVKSDQHLLFADGKVLYIDLLQAKFQFSS